MARLEEYAKEKEQDKEVYKLAAVKLLHRGDMDAQCMKKIIDTVFQLGHNAGHCRGEGYRRRQSS